MNTKRLILILFYGNTLFCSHYSPIPEFMSLSSLSLNLGRMCGSPGVTKSKMLNVCMLWSIFMLFSSFLLQKIYQSCIPASWCLLLAAVCVACFWVQVLSLPSLDGGCAGLLNKRRWIFVLFCGNLYLLFQSYIALWLPSFRVRALSLLPNLDGGCTGLLNERRWIFVLFSGNLLYSSIAISLTPKFPVWALSLSCQAWIVAVLDCWIREGEYLFCFVVTFSLVP